MKKFGIEIIAQKTPSVVKQASNLLKSTESDHIVESKNQVGAAMVFGLVGLVFTSLALVCTDRAKKAYDAHVQWKELDEKLDQVLAESLDASDAVGSY